MILKTSRYSIVILICIVVLYIAFAATDIERPGLETDEALHAPAAIRLLHPDLASKLWVFSAISFAGRDWPVMTMDYMGALKSYLLAASFLVFGPSVTTLRLTTIMIGAAVLVLTYLFVLRGWGTAAALITAAILGSDPSFVLMTRTDWGPVALPMLFRCAAMYAIILWLQERKPFYAGAAGLSLGLGLYDKANFLWFVIALVLLGIVGFIRGSVRPSRRDVAAICAAFVLGSLPFWWWNMSQNWATFRFAAAGNLNELEQGYPLWRVLLDQLPSRLLSLRYLFSGTGLDIYMFGRSIAPWLGSYSATLFIPVFVLSLGLIALFVKVPMVSPIDWRSVLFPLAMAGLLLAQMLITPLNLWLHHFIFLYPFPQLFVGITLGQALTRVEPGAFRRVLGPVAGFSLIALVASNSAVVWQYHQLMATHPGSNIWSTAIYNLNDVLLAEHREQTIQVLDWNIGNQLLLLSAGELRVHELWIDLNGPETEDAFLHAIENKSNLFVLPYPGTATFERPSEVFQRAVNLQTACESRIIRDQVGTPRYMLFGFCE